jgi:hypothetical protein
MSKYTEEQILFALKQAERGQSVKQEEQTAEGYLKSLDIGSVVYEPDGKVPPDFLIDGRIAVEVRRLNQHYEAHGRLRGLEEDSISLRQSLENMLHGFAAPESPASWFVMFSFSRPLPDRRTLSKGIRKSLSEFLLAPTDTALRIPIAESFDLTLIRSTETYSERFVIGGYTDMDSGGWIVSEVVRNASAYIAEKSLKVTPYLGAYPVWWLVFIDHIALGGEVEEVRQHISRSKPWDRIVFLSPSGEHSYEI